MEDDYIADNPELTVKYLKSLGLTNQEISRIFDLAAAGHLTDFDPDSIHQVLKLGQFEWISYDRTW